MATAALRDPTTLDAFLPWEERQAERWELVDGQLFLMTGGTIGHDLITGSSPTRSTARWPGRPAGPTARTSR